MLSNFISTRNWNEAFLCRSYSKFSFLSFFCRCYCGQWIFPQLHVLRSLNAKRKWVKMPTSSRLDSKCIKGTISSMRNNIKTFVNAFGGQRIVSLLLCNVIAATTAFRHYCRYLYIHWRRTLLHSLSHTQYTLRHFIALYCLISFAFTFAHSSQHKCAIINLWLIWSACARQECTLYSVHTMASSFSCDNEKPI